MVCSPHPNGDDMSSSTRTRPLAAPAKGLAPRDLINIGVFSAIYFAVTFIGAMIGFLGPVMMFVGFALSVLINGTVIMLFLARTRVLGALTIMGLVVGILMVLMGHVWYTLAVTPVLGILADLIVRSGRYRSGALNVLAYGVFSLWMVTPLMPIIFQADAYFAQSAQDMGQAYADSMRRLVTPWFIAGWAVVEFLISVVSAWIGTRILRKHFVRAGIV